jgi:hypothetical protein
MAVERVYHNHRLATNSPFEKVMTREAAENLVRAEQHKEAVLQKVYHVVITEDQVRAEMQRIEKSTRTPEILREIKATLGNDTKRFQRTVVRPLLVDQILRERFGNDMALHALARRRCEQARQKLLDAKSTDLVRLEKILREQKPDRIEQVSWEFRPSPNTSESSEKLSFADLPPTLQKVLDAQLRSPGNVSAVIEMPSEFLLYVARARTPEALSVVCAVFAKVDFEVWLRRN